MADFNWNRYLLWLGGVLLVAWVVYWYTQRDWEERVVWIPSSLFQRKPFLVAELLFEKQEKEVQVHRDIKWLDELLYSVEPTEHFVVLADGYRALNSEQAELLRDWILDGGHLVMSMDNRFEPGRFGETRWDRVAPDVEGNRNLKELEEGQDPLLAPLGVSRVEVDSDVLEESQQCEKVESEQPAEQNQIASETDGELESLPLDGSGGTEGEQKAQANLGEVNDDNTPAEEQPLADELLDDVVQSALDSRTMFCEYNEIREFPLDNFSGDSRVHHYYSDWRWELDGADPLYIAGDVGGVLFAKISLGEGSITLLPGDEVWSNQLMACEDNAWFLVRSARDASRVDIIRNLDAEFLLLKLWRYSAIGLLATLACLLLWVWRHLVRFGSVLEVEFRQQRQFGDHLRAFGQLFWRHKLGDESLEVIRQDIWQRLQRRMKNFHDADQQQRLLVLSEITGINQEALEFGLAPLDNNPGSRAFIERAEILRIIVEKL